VPNYRSRHRDGLITATVRVVMGTPAEPEASCGTGFFVAPGLVVTCAHVVPEIPDRRVVVWYGTQDYTAEVLVCRPPDAQEKNYSHPDVALLRVPLTDHPCVPLGGDDPPAAGRELFAYGCPLLPDGAFWEHMPMVSEGTRDGLATGEQWIKTSRAQVQAGASGSGAVDLETGLLVGMLKLSRGPQSDLGGVLVPTATIVRTLAKGGHDVASANRAAVDGYDTVGSVRRRLGRLLTALESDLSKDIGPAQLSLMLYELGDRPPESVGALDAALALIHVELRTLATALTELARACYCAAQPTRVLGNAASLAVLGNQAWVDPRAAELLVAERDSATPRIVQVPGSRTRTVGLYAIRATTRRNVTLVELAYGDAESDPVTGLPVRLLSAVRCELLRGSVRVPEDDPAEIERLWRANRADALADAGRVLFLLPDGADDADLLARLQQEFPPCLFVLATRRLRPEVRSSGLVLELPGALPVEVERAAEERYAYLTDQIVEAAG